MSRILVILVALQLAGCAFFDGFFGVLQPTTIGAAAGCNAADVNCGYVLDPATGRALVVIPPPRGTVDTRY
jgi:hypothetical protein